MRSLALVAALGFLVGCADSDDMITPKLESTLLETRKAEEPELARTYEVTVENLTSGGQHFTPPLVAIHQGSVDFFTVGKEASSEIQQIAENGNLGPMLDELETSKHVSSYTVAVSGDGLEGPLAPGEAVTVSLTGGSGFEFVSFASMLICTNDGFTGVDGVMLPRRVGEEVHIYAGAYDAGTEINTEDFADLVPPCQILGGVSSGDAGTGASDPALWEGGVVRAHEGIMDRSDLVSSVHGWMDPVAMFSVRRVG